MIVDDFMNTSREGVFAAGDVAEYRGKVLGIWPVAQEQGRIADLNMAGVRTPYSEVVSSNYVNVFDTEIFSISRKVGGVNVKEILEKALRFEQEGYDYYKKISSQMTNPLAKRLFDSLAQQEKIHEEIIKKIYDSQNFDSAPPYFSKAPLLEQELKNLFFQLEESERKMPLDHIEGYKLAMEMEKRGYEMYKKFYSEAESEGEKKFFEALMKEELEHLNSLDNVYRFLTGTEIWYSEEESKVWNWMNT